MAPISAAVSGLGPGKKKRNRGLQVKQYCKCPKISNILFHANFCFYAVIRNMLGGNTIDPDLFLQEQSDLGPH